MTITGTASATPYTVTATGSDGSFDKATATFTITTPATTLVPTQGLSGVTVTASGSGFTPGATIVFTISAGGTIGAASACTATGTGTISGCTFTVSGAAAAYTVTATGSDGGADKATATFTVTTPGITLAPIVTAAAVNTTGISVSWSAVPGAVNYTLMYARFPWLPIAYVSVGTATVYNLTNLGFGLTYYITVWAWNNTSEGPPSNVAVAQTDVPAPPAPPFPWATLEAVTTLSVLGSLAVSAAIAVWVSGRRGRRAQRTATASLAVTLARSRPRPGEINEPPNRDRRRP